MVNSVWAVDLAFIRQELLPNELIERYRLRSARENNKGS